MRTSTHIPVIVRMICPRPSRLCSSKPLDVEELWICGTKDRSVATIEWNIVMTIKEVLFRTRYELRCIRESRVIDQWRYRPKACRAGRPKSIEGLVAFPALALTIQFSVAIVSAAIVLRDGATAACAVVIL